MRKAREFGDAAKELVNKAYEAGYRAGYQARQRKEGLPIEDENPPLPLYREGDKN